MGFLVSSRRGCVRGFLNRQLHYDAILGGFRNMGFSAPVLNKLIANNIMAVVDVRNNPQSMKYGFSKKSFKQYILSPPDAIDQLDDMRDKSPMRSVDL